MIYGIVNLGNYVRKTINNTRKIKCTHKSVSNYITAICHLIIYRIVRQNFFGGCGWEREGRDWTLYQSVHKIKVDIKIVH